MAIQSTTSPSILDPSAKSSASIKAQTVALRQQGPLAVQVAEALDTLEARANLLQNALQQPLPVPDEYQILDPRTGELIAAMGYIVGADHKVYPGIYARYLYVGPGGPDTAVLYSDGFSVQIGKNGFVKVLDPYGNTGAWIGSQTEASHAVTGAVNNGSGAIRLTVTAHGFRNGNWVAVDSVGGVPNATGQWLIAVVDANHFDLLGSTFAGTYTAGGNATRFFSGGAFETIAVGAGQRITNVVDNGSGLARLTIPNHGYKTGYAVVITNVQGAVITGTNGIPLASYLVTVINANTVDLQASKFSGTYTSGGVAINWPTAKLVAEGDGSLYITNALITLVGTGNPSSTITLDPNHGTISVAANSPGTLESVLDASGLTMYSQAGSANGAFLSNNSLQFYETVTRTQDYPPLYTTSGATSVMTPQLVAVENGAASVIISMNAVSGKLQVFSSGTITLDSADSSISADGHISTADIFKCQGHNGLSIVDAIPDTAVGANGLTVTTATAVTSVSGSGVSSTSGTFVTGVSLSIKLQSYAGGIRY